MATTPTQTHTRHPLVASSAKYLAPVQSAENSAHCVKLTASDKSTPYAEVTATVTPKESAHRHPGQKVNVTFSNAINGLPQSTKSRFGSNSLKKLRSYNRSAAQGGKSHLAEILTCKNFVAGNAENKSGQKCLPVVGVRGYGNSAPAKSGVGCRNPAFVRAHNRAYAVFLCATHGYTQSMVGRAGQPKGWPGSLATGIPTPVRLTTNSCRKLGGELSNLSQEASTMAKPLYVWRFYSCQRSIYDTVTACTEFEARSQLPDSPCLFAARLPVGGVEITLAMGEMTTPSTLGQNPTLGQKVEVSHA